VRFDPPPLVPSPHFATQNLAPLGGAVITDLVYMPPHPPCIFLCYLRLPTYLECCLVRCSLHLTTC